MIAFPNAKINIGLHVRSKRADGFHELETVFYPIAWSDIIEVIEHKDHTKAFTLTFSGIEINGNTEDNLIYKAWKLLSEKYTLPPIQVHLHKAIPMGAGLGGGSSDAAFFINLLDEKFSLAMSEVDKLNLAKQLGSDCAFFITNESSYAQEKGDVLSPIDLNLDPYFILVVYPGIHSNTRLAYQSLTPKIPETPLKEILRNYSIKEWKDVLKNDFESGIFKTYPEIKSLKKHLYEIGAIYVSLSGSGSAVYAIFENEPSFTLKQEYLWFLQKPKRKIL